MRILHLRFKNLNSLAGEWSIDFTHPDYEGNGIFAIIGPTGAGKSTLLDAICLALYGKTPRLDKISQSSNEIMARQTGECFAEVTFETARGKYRSFWGQHRSHKKAGGELQKAQREIVDATTNAVLESQLKGVDAKIEEITGMDFQRFTRSMLLAQGGFDAFLKASPSERAPILEQMTGTEIYTKISIGVFERSKTETKQLEDLEKDLEKIPLLSPEDRDSYHLEFQEKTAEVECLAGKLQRLNEHKKWREEVDRNVQDLKEIEHRWNVYIEKEKSAEPDLRRLELALKALNFEGDYRDLCSLMNQQRQDLEKLTNTAARKSDLDKDCIEKSQCLEKERKRFEELQKTRENELEIIQRVREIDRDEKKERTNLLALSERLTAAEEKAAVHKQHLEECRKKEGKHKADLRNVQAYFGEHAIDALLLEKFSSIEGNLDRLQRERKRIEQKQNELQGTLKQLENAKSRESMSRSKVDEAKTNIEKSERALKSLEEDYQTASQGKDPLEWHEERTRLERRGKLLGELKKALEGYQKHESHQKGVLERMQFGKEQLAVFREREKGLLAEKETINHKIESLDRQRMLHIRIQSFEEQRAQLCKNEPCPLCGALEHPYAYEAFPDLGHGDELLRKAKQEMDDIETRCLELAKEISKSETEIKNYSGSLEEDRKALGNFKQSSLDLCKQLGCSDEDFLGAVELHEECARSVEEFILKHTFCLEKKKEKEKAQEKHERELGQYALLKGRLDDSTKERNDAEAHANYLQKELEQCKKDHEDLGRSLLDSLQRYGVSTLQEVDLNALKEGLNFRVVKWKEQQEAERQLEKNSYEVSSQIATLTAQLESVDGVLKALLDEKMLCAASAEELHGKRQHLFGAKNPDEEEKSIDKRMESARRDLDALKENFTKMQNQRENLDIQIRELIAGTQGRGQRLQSDEEKFIGQIHGAGFLDLEAYKQASLGHEERALLERTKADLEKMRSELSADKKVAQKRFDELNQEPKTEQALAVLVEQIREAEQLLEDRKGRVFILNNILIEDKRRQEQAKDVQEKIVLQRKEADIWKGLCGLIGAGDGKKFRDFAQKMTLDMMIAHANRQLVKMSDRYLLKQSQGSSLELEVVDNYQAGEERSVKNLSGGEGFIVSLSLALGLSQMSSSKVRVDTLFLDEGFGTLDERALEVALDALSELHQEGKVIGLISHVAVLKDRISTQIKVEPLSGGRSRIEGPGCSCT